MPVDDKGDARPVNPRRWAAWSEIFRTFQLARDPSKLLLGAGAVLALWAGWGILGLLIDPSAGYGDWPANSNRGPSPFVTVLRGGGDLFTGDFWFGGSGPGREPPLQFEPFRQFFQPVVDLVTSNPGHREWWYAFLGIFWTLLVWGVCAGAITRIAAVQIARREKIGLTEAVRFALGKLGAYVAAPLIPMAVIAFMAVLQFLGGLFILIPYLGIILVAVLFFLWILAGIVAVVMVIAYIGWPLMYGTIGAEGSDSFDALSRSLAYVTQRPLSYLVFSLGAFLYGVLSIFLVVFLVSFAVFMAKWGLNLVTPLVSWQHTDDPVSTMFVYAPTAYHWRDMLAGDHVMVREGKTLDQVREAMNWGQVAAASIMALWLHAIFLLMVGFAYSFYWCAGTVIYFLLRKEVDDTDLDEVYLEDEDEDLGYAPAPATEGAAPAAAPATLPLATTEPPKNAGAPVPPPPPPSAPVSEAAKPAEPPPTASGNGSSGGGGGGSTPPSP